MTHILFHSKHYVCVKPSLSFKTLVMFAMHIHIILHPAPHNNYYILFIYLQQSSFLYLQDKFEKNRNVINSCYYGECQMLQRKILSLSNLSFFENEPSFHENTISERKNELLWIYAWWLSGHLCFNGRQKSPVASLNWNPWSHNLVSNRIFVSFVGKWVNIYSIQ